MPLNKSGLKRERQDKVRNAHNRIVKSKVHTAYRKLNEAIIAKNREEVEANLRVYMSEVDKAVKLNVLQRNNGARKKSRIVKKIKTVFNENVAN